MPGQSDHLTDATTIHRRFRDRARRHPEAVAIRCDTNELTYRQLDAYSDRIAVGLRAHGVRPGDRIGILTGRSERTVVAMLAVLKLGCGYVPLDAAHPIGRLRHIVSDARPRLVIGEVNGPRIPETDTVPFDDLDRDGAVIEWPEDPAAPAYTVYTSGTTGRPKGVVIAHRSVVSLIDATTRPLELTESDVWTWFHSAAFDFSVWEIWGPLLTGARLVVVPDDARRSPEALGRLLRREAVTVVNQTPTAFQQLAAVELDTGDPLPVRLFVFGGETLHVRSLLPWLERHPRCRLVNMYGITETTVHVTWQPITPPIAALGSRSVGTAIDGWAVRVVDDRLRDRPTGEVGEIVVAGAGLAVGYLNRPELTAARFVTDPATGVRWYRSGDLGRMAADGTLEHLGRTDDQVQLRGHRIEPAEVHAVLTENPNVREAAVVLRHGVADDDATARLDAYVVVAEDAASVSPSAIREQAAQMLPEYMVPSTVTVLPALPLTDNGKLDRRALPPPSFGADDATRSDDAVDVVTATWREVLGVPIGPDDDFFDAGGNSLLAMRLMRDLRRRLDVDLTIAEIYEHPSPARLTRALAQRDASDERSAILP